MPEFSNYVEAINASNPVVGALDGTELMAGSKDGSAAGWTTQQVADLGAGGGGTVTSVTGTANRIAVDPTNPAVPVINIDAAYDAAVTAEINAAVSASAGGIGNILYLYNNFI